MSDIVIEVYGLCFIMALIANIKLASHPFILQMRFDLGFMNYDATNAYLMNI